MASTHADIMEADQQSPRSMRRVLSSGSDASAAAGHGAPKCVCAPATHAGSFKCRLHRANSHGHSSPTATSAAASASSS